MKNGNLKKKLCIFFEMLLKFVQQNHTLLYFKKKIVILYK